MSLPESFFRERMHALARYQREGWIDLDDFMRWYHITDEHLAEIGLLEPKPIRSTTDLRRYQVAPGARDVIYEDAAMQLLLFQDDVALMLRISAARARMAPELVQAIPPGIFCYGVEPTRPGEEFPNDPEFFGFAVRERPHSPGFKQVLCPHWQRTDRETARCKFLGIEETDGDPASVLSDIRKLCGLGGPLRR